MSDTLTTHSHARAIVRYGLYPFSWAVVLLGFHQIWTSGAEPRLIWAMSSGFLVLMYLFIEWALPYEKRWSMTWQSFLSDLRFAIVNGAVVGGMSAVLALFTITISGDLSGPAKNWPPLVQLLACLLIFEAINYAFHRAMHEMRGPVGKFLWALHAAHHLPPRLYVVMHAVFHPLNGILIQGFAIILPIWLMGYDQKVVTMFLMINGFHGLISHFNVDVRMGWLNYVFVGPELHRYHHSARVDEAKNYGATLSIYDWMFGTFIYRPGVPPEELGVSPESGLPAYERTWDVLKQPFRNLMSAPRGQP
jgi:sterol desaturase/sphingolipid hydroxylase (fatty acid hydroxylase superfamily)